MANVLLIEKDETLIQTFVEALKKEFYNVVVARDGSDGMNKFSNGRFQLLITDLNLPKMSGQKIIEYLMFQKNGDLPCPIIICSEDIDPKTIQEFAAHEKIHFLPKPCKTEELITKVSFLLSNKTKAPIADVRFINPILDATMTVLKEMTGFNINVGKPYTKAANEISGDISGVVGLVSSGFKGHVSISFPKDGFLKVVSSMLGETYSEISDENKDAVAEILNIIFGQAKKTLNETGLNIRPAIPTIVLGENHSIKHQTKHSTIVIPFSSEETGAFRIELSIIGI